MMLFTLNKIGDFYKILVSDFKTRVLSDGGNFEAETNLENQLNTLGSDLFNSASLVITPNAYKEQTLYSATPSTVGNNLFVRSSEFENSAWTKTLLTISSTLSTAPNTLLEARTVQTPVDTTSNRHRLSQSLNSFINKNTPYTFSIYAKKNQHRWIQLNFVIGFDINNWANFDLENGVIGNKGTDAIATIENVGNGWYRLSIVGNPVEGQSNYNAEVITTGNINSGRYPSHQSTVAENVFDIWGAQVEIGTVAGPYIPTVNKQVINGTICDFTTSRATTATRVNEQGLIETVPYNILSYSEDFSNSYWVKTNYTVVPNSGISPIGTMTASLIVPSISGTLDFRNTTVNGVGGETHIWSCYIKSNGLRYISLTAWNTDDPITYFDLQNGVIVSQSGPPSTAKITNVGNGWYLCEVSRVLRKDSLGIWLRIGVTNLNGSNLNGSNGYLIWGAQVVRSNEPKPYQLTTNRQNIPRIDYTNGSPSILIEPQRTNLSLQSEDFTNGWTQEGISIISNTQLSPDGTLTADSIFELETNDVHRTYRTSNISVTANSTYTSSFFVKKNNVRYVRLILTQQGSTTIWAGAQFDLDTKTFTSQVGTGGGVFSGASITSLTNGWYRISVSGSITGTAMIPMLVLSNGATMVNTDTRGCPVYLGNVNNELYVWGGQLELGTSVTSYIPTTTATVTRNADVISNTNASTLIGQTEGTIFIDYNKVLSNDSARNIISINDGSTTNLIEIWDGVSAGTLGRIIYIYFANSLGKATGNGQSTVSPSGRYKICLTYAITPSLVNFKFFINGVKLDDRNFTYTAFSSPLSRINIGNRNGTAVGHGGHDLDFILKTRITDEQAIQLTTL